MGQPLIDEAMRKAAVAWVEVADQPARLVWCVPVTGSLWLVTGPGEQQLPGLAGADRAVVTLRGSHGGRVVSWPAAVRRLDPAGERWAELAPQLAGKRLNASGDAASLVARWAAECEVYEFAPAEGPVAAAGSLPDTSLAEPPRESPARRAVRTPFRLHRVRRR
ncbi:hypothetical protein JQS43_21510 [Natronosporangium hydrolyticum]|uniref:Uncharacterized protein n=1 Tax=Natronosporangium hydrolyticum TaxID=2811111 RepID=A0A895YF97_9ACTN|nr:hypothetical protein [Natronosporangium hydrolyticum]QSB14083.1 hypothetical protein JQS43_21510 [Natronosporangium hydrolyticum]